MTTAAPEPERMHPQDADAMLTDEDPLARFRNWRGFFFATVAVNVLFVYGMWANVADPAMRIWFKTLVWLPFNAIASALYFMFMLRLRPVGIFYAWACAALIVANWVVMWRAGH